MAEQRAWLNMVKSYPCLDCGISFHPNAMDFDHVRGQKVSPVSASARFKDRLKEIIKCELVCSNCHRLRHAL